MLKGYSEVVTIDVNTDQHQIKVIVPDNYKDLKDAYLKMTKNYVESEYDLTNIIRNNDSLIQAVDKLKLDINDLLSLNKESIILLKEKVKKPFWESIIFISSAYYINSLTNNIDVSIGYGGLLLGRAFLGLSIGYPLNSRIEIGFKF
jgi:hypothetical protein